MTMFVIGLIQRPEKCVSATIPPPETSTGQMELPWTAPGQAIRLGPRHVSQEQQPRDQVLRLGRDGAVRICKFG